MKILDGKIQTSISELKALVATVEDVQIQDLKSGVKSKSIIIYKKGNGEDVALEVFFD